MGEVVKSGVESSEMQNVKGALVLDVVERRRREGEEARKAVVRR